MTKARKVRQDNLFCTRLPAPEVCGGEVTDPKSLFSLLHVYLHLIIPRDKLESCSNTVLEPVFCYTPLQNNGQRCTYFVFLFMVPSFAYIADPLNIDGT